MMSKFNLNKTRKGFTLAEVLVTLAIIGVVAALTIPSLIKSYQMTTWHAAMKKNYSDLSQAFNMVKSDNGGTLKYLNPAGIGDQASCTMLLTKISPYLKTVKTCNGAQAVTGGCLYSEDIKTLNGVTLASWYYKQNPSAVVLTNGAIVTLMYDQDEGDCGDNNIQKCGNSEVFIDVNGNKSPNTVGKDVYGFVLTANGLAPYGVGTTAAGTDCISDSTDADNWGLICSSYVLKNQDY